VKSAKSVRETGFVALDGAVYAEPLVVGDTVIVATEGGSLYGIRGDSIAWRVNLAPPVPGGSLQCGNIDPSGITGTPVYDPATSTVYAVTFADSPFRHILMAVDPSTGKLRWQRIVDPPGADPGLEQQRAALALAGNSVWIAYGGLYGDCGNYHGYLVGVSASGDGALAVYQTPSARQAGIWAPSGPAVDSAGHVFVSVGNGAATSGQYDMSDSVLELSGTNVVSYFAPSSWAKENATDGDLGSTGPLVLPNGFVAIAGKGGTLYLLKAGSLGGIGGAVASLPGCVSFGGMAYAAGVLYAPCTAGLRAVKVGAGGSLTPAWQAPAGVNGSPVVAGGAVLTLDTQGNRLYVLDAASGAVRASGAVGSDVTNFATPTVTGDAVYVGTTNGLAIFTLS
jgi:hypothetical protein